MNARTFGTDASYQASLERHNAKYGTADPIEQGRMIVAAQRAANARREQADSPAVPSTPATLIRLASDKAVNFLVALSAERTPAVAEDKIRAWAASVDRALVSEKIDWLKTQPKVSVTPVADVPAGRYAVTGEQGHTVFVKVDRPTEGEYKGRTFVKVQAGSEYHKLPWTTAKAILAKIEHDGVQAACVRYGQELGFCGRCGRELTDAESRAAGIGPVCISKGW